MQLGQIYWVPAGVRIVAVRYARLGKGNERHIDKQPNDGCNGHSLGFCATVKQVDYCHNGLFAAAFQCTDLGYTQAGYHM